MTSYLRQAREYLTPVRQTSGFLSKGVLTPTEFVQAGDELVFKCPTWSWESGDESKSRGHLPKEKQYLITRNVPCPMRASTMENSILSETEVEIPSSSVNNEDESGWLMSHILNSIQQQAEEEKNKLDEDEDDGFDLVNSDGEVIPKEPTPTLPSSAAEEEEEESEYANMEDYEDSNILMDDDQVTTPAVSDSNILKVRTYDVSITYDKYYQTPRVWIFGYATDGTTPLTTEEMFQDVMSDYVQKTVTIETHPHKLGPHLSIHPCQHAAVMKNIIRNMMSSSSDNAPNVDMYIFIFLKFVSCIIPTLQYDFTMDVDADVQTRN